MSRAPSGGPVHPDGLGSVPALDAAFESAGIRRIVPGHAPNCSSAGSVVSMGLFTLAAASAVLAVWAPWLTRWRSGRTTPGDGPPPGVRADARGGVVHDRRSGTRLHVTPDVVADLEARGVPVVHAPAAPAGAPGAPDEVHLSMTGRCPVACRACYLSAGPTHAPADPQDLGRTLDRLAEQGVQQVALGGGEGIGRLDVVGLGRAALDRGLVPNLTTSGFGLTDSVAAACADVFGQVNVSLDGLAEDYRATRGWDGAAQALRAIERLVAAGVRTGVNTVLGRSLLTQAGALEQLGRVLRDAGVAEWQWLRLKPVGRGRAEWDALAPTSSQLATLWSHAERVLAEVEPMVLRWDCALVPFLPDTDARPELAWRLGVRGCPAGDTLAARDHTGRYAPCSFAVADAPPVELAEFWRTDAQVAAWRARAADPPQPCARCDWRAVCRGGCRVVAAHVTGDPLAPDPQCPRVVAYRAGAPESA